MAKILVELSGNGLVSCCRQQCLFKRNCANHREASLHRMSEGFSPVLFEEGGQFYCSTCDEKNTEDYPLDNMGVGAVYLDENFDFRYPHNEVNCGDV